MSASGPSSPVRINAGFIPLLDTALLVAAREMGFAADEGVDLVLAKETSWANIRDRIAIGHFDVAHMLAPLPIAAALGKGPMDTEIIAPMAMGLGGNAVTVSTALWREMAAEGALETGDATVNGTALRRVSAARAKAGRPVPVFGIVHRYSSHNYELRYWLAASGVRPDVDAAFVVVPPPFTADALAAGQIDGFCVGEPWNSHAVAKGVGVIATTKSAIWRSSPEKVLGVRAAWAAENGAALHARMSA